jgi:general secretion pathway protein A
MYAGYFGLKQAPFSIAPDPHYLYMSERHREALAHLLYGLEGGGGFVLLSGEIGAGKTTICRCFLEQVPAHCNVAYIFNPKLTVGDLLKSICHEFHVEVKHEGMGPATIKDYLDPLNDYLLRSHAAGQHNILIIDEAQNLTSYVLEQLRLLTNLETRERKLLQIILIGQPELREMLARPELEQLAQRVIARFHLGALTEKESRQYIQHRMAVAGLQGPLPFSEGALHRIHAIARGVPRRINLLCDRALLGAYASGQHRVERDVVNKAAGEVFDSGDAPAVRGHTSPKTLWRLNPLALGALGGALTAATLFGIWTLFNPLAVAPDQARSSSANIELPAQAPAPGPANQATKPEAGPAAASVDQPAVVPMAVIPAPGPPPPGSLLRSEGAALRELGLLWKQDISAGDPCTVAQAEGIQCYRTSRMTLHGMRQLDRPAALELRLPGTGTGWALLTRITSETATLSIGDNQWLMPLTALADIWRGDYTTLFRLPPGHEGRLGVASTGPAGAWLGKQLEAMQSRGELPPGANNLQDQVKAFQASRGAAPDGIPGPMTLMLINRASGVDEPHLIQATP